ncbi:MAG: hypothetical protein WCJ51_03750 [Candidatus Moraniibacteriota bacterium]
MSEQWTAPKFEARRTIEQKEQPEKFADKLRKDPNVEAVISLAFVRHATAAKEKGAADERRTLDEKGIATSRAKTAEILDTKPEQVLVIGSPRDRTGHTGMSILVGDNEDFAEVTAFDPLLKKLDGVEDDSAEKPRFGSRLGTSKDLDYYMNPESDYYKNDYEPSIGNKNYLEAFVDGSDEKAKAAGDEITSTYLRQAQQGARLVERYEKASPQWAKFLERHKDEQEKNAEGEETGVKKYDKVLQRLLPNHMGVGECFLAKVIELAEGTEKRNEFVEILKKDGFDYVEYFKVFIVEHKNDGQKVFVEYRHKNKETGEQDFEFVQGIEPSLIENILK